MTSRTNHAFYKQIFIIQIMICRRSDPQYLGGLCPPRPPKKGFASYSLREDHEKKVLLAEDPWEGRSLGRKALGKEGPWGAATSQKTTFVYYA